MFVVEDFVQQDYALAFCIVGPFLAFIFSYIYYRNTTEIILDPRKLAQVGKASLIVNKRIDSKQTSKIWDNLIYDGLHGLLYSEYRYISIFVAIVLVMILVVLEAWVSAIFTTIVFIVGCAMIFKKEECFMHY